MLNFSFGANLVEFCPGRSMIIFCYPEDRSKYSKLQFESRVMFSDGFEKEMAVLSIFD